jgi:hypothetical protein
MALLRKPEKPKERGSRIYKRTAVNSYYRSKNQPGQTSPFKNKPVQKKRRRYLLGFIDVILIIVLLLGLVNSLLLSSSPKVSVTDFSYRPLSQYQAQVKAAFAGVKNRNKVTFDTQSVTKKIETDFPEVQAVQIELPFFSQEPRARLVVSPPAFKLTGVSQVYIIDSQGIAVAKASSLPKISDLVAVNDQSGFGLSIGKQALSSQSVGFIQALIRQCQRSKVKIASLTLPALPQEIDLRTADQPYFVKFYLGGDVDIETGQFLAARQKFAQSSITPAEYLDVRVAGKIFYK